MDELFSSNFMCGFILCVLGLELTGWVCIDYMDELFSSNFMCGFILCVLVLELTGCDLF